MGFFDKIKAGLTKTRDALGRKGAALTWRMHSVWGK